MTHNKINYLDMFHAQGYRMTRQRQAILDAVCSVNGHVTIGEIYYQTKKIDKSIDRSTIYRSLDLFEKLGLVIPGEKVDGEQTYEMVQENQHHHLICTNCGMDVEIDNRIVDNFYDRVSTNYDYDVVMDHLIVRGICRECSD